MGPEIDVQALSQLSSENLRVLLRKIPGSKDLIIEPKLIPPLDKIAGMNMIKSCGVDRVFKLEQRWPDASAAATKVYFTTPSLEQTKFIIDHLAMSGNIQQGLTFHVIYLPRVLREIQVLLEEEGVIGKVTMHDYMWELIPLDYDLLSLELNYSFSQVFQDGDTSSLSAVATGLYGLQTLFGKIGQRVSVGKHSTSALEQLELLEQVLGGHSPSRDISHLFVVDRSIDYATLLLNPLTYEALLNEVFKNVCGTIDLDERVTKGDHIKLQLSSKDKMFAKIRSQHFSSIFSSLSAYAKQLKQQQAKAANMSINEMKAFVQKELKEVQNQSKAVALHIGACEVIQQEKGPIYEFVLPLEHGLVNGTCYKETVAHLEDIMAQMQPMTTALRLLCLLSLSNSGISSGDYERLKHQFLQAYGFEHLLTFQKLKRMGILTSREALASLKGSASGDKSNPTFLQIAKKLSLNKSSNQSQSSTVVASSQMQEDVSYVFNGSYTPLVTKLVRDGLSLDKAKLQEDLKELKVKFKMTEPPSASDQQQQHSGGKVVVVFFVGGYTFSEVAAFRHLQTILGYQFIICGTSSISGQDLVTSTL